MGLILLGIVVVETTAAADVSGDSKTIKEVSNFNPELLQPSATPRPSTIEPSNSNSSKSKIPESESYMNLLAIPSITATVANYNTIVFTVTYNTSGIYGNRLEMWNSVMGWVDVSNTYYTVNGTYSVTNLAPGSYMGRLTYLNNNMWVTVDQWVQIVPPQSSTSYQYQSGKVNTIISNKNNTYTKINYTYDLNGNITKKVRVMVPKVDSPTTTDVSAVSYDVFVNGVNPAIQTVYVYVWTDANGQDDIERITAKNVGSGIWKAVVPLANHHSETGLYYNDVWTGADVSYGGVYYGGNTTVVQSNVSLRRSTTAKFRDDFFEIYVDNVPERVTKLLFPTWTDKNGQDDILYTPGVKVGQNTWKVRIEFKDHNSEIGNYITHIYAYDEYMNFIFVRGFTTEVLKSVETPANVSLASAAYTVFAYGVDKNVSAITFYTWTAYGGQDDLKAVQGTKVKDGVWKATVYLNQHNNETGLYYNDIWISNTSGVYFGGASTVVQ